MKKLVSSLAVLVGGTVSWSVGSFLNSDEPFFKNILMPAIHATMDPERAHELAILSAHHNLVPWSKEDPSDVKETMSCSVAGLMLQNPIGLAAGFDKNGTGITGLSNMGFGMIEVGSVTPMPQEGNPRPRVFRVLSHMAIINRYGFNSEGHNYVNNLLKELDKKNGLILGLNLGKNKVSAEDSDEDYIKGLSLFRWCDKVDYFVINISSPNTPGLRLMEKGNRLKQLLSSVETFMKSNPMNKPLFIKISPDLEDSELQATIKVIMSKPKVVQGIIIANTTVSRPEDITITEAGGLSGKPLTNRSTECIRRVYRLTGGRLPIIGVGGISSGQDAFDKIHAGASCIQLLTALTFEGPPIVHAIKRDLNTILRSHGYRSIQEAVGKEHKK